jgi:hypothetical protein
MAASSMYGADQAKDASKDAARSQRQAANAQLNFQRNAALAGLQQNYPVYSGQINALNRLYGMQGMPSIQAAPLNALLAQYGEAAPTGSVSKLPWGMRRAVSTGLINEDQAMRYAG